MCWYGKQLSLAYELMRTRRAVLLTPPLQTSASPKNHLSPFLATDPKKQPVSPIIATLPKTPSCKPFVCHTCGPLPPFDTRFGTPLRSFSRHLAAALAASIKTRGLDSTVWLNPLECVVLRFSRAKSFRMRSYKKKWGEVL